MGQGYLMDTNAIVDFFGGNLPISGKNKLLTIEPAISVITSIELFCSNNIPPDEIIRLQFFVKAATVYNVIDEKIVNQAISIRKKHKVKTADAIIAATALVNGLILITRNTRDFIKIENLILINPWEM